MDVQQLSCKDSQFDYIFAFQTHFHWENLSAGLVELKRTLKQDGEIILTCEYAKIKYYLPHLRDNQEFSKYLESLGLVLKGVGKSKEWVAYFIQKKVRL